MGKLKVSEFKLYVQITELVNSRGKFRKEADFPQSVGSSQESILFPTERWGS